MFYSHEVLTSRKYGVATVWLVATLGSKSSLKRINRKQILDVDVAKACQTIVDPVAPMALRLQGNLLYGVSRVYLQQCGYVLSDAQNAQNALLMMLRTVKNFALDPDAGKARPEQLILQDDPSFLPEFTIPPLELLADLDLGFDFTVNRSGESQSLTPFGSQSSSHDGPLGGLILPSSSPGQQGSFHLEGDNEVPGPSGLLVPDNGFQLDEPEFTFDDNGEWVENAPRSGAVETPAARSAGPMQSDAGASAKVRREHEEGREGGIQLPGDPMDLELPFLGNDLPEGKAFPTAEQQSSDQVEVVHSTSTTSAPMRKKRRAARVLPTDFAMELRNKDLADWNANYLDTMDAAIKVKKLSRVALQAKKDAEYFLWGRGLGGIPQQYAGLPGLNPFDMFIGDNLFELVTGESRKKGVSKKHDRDSGIDDATQDESRRVRQKTSEPEEELGRGQDDEGFSMPGGDEVELPREAVTALDDQQIFSSMPWNNTASKHGSSAIRGSRRLGLLDQGRISSRPGSRLISASPLHGRGQPLGLEALKSLESDGDIDMYGDEYGPPGPSSPPTVIGTAQHTHTCVSEALSAEGTNFLDFVTSAILEKRNRAQATLDPMLDVLEAEATFNINVITFAELLPPQDNKPMTACQGLMMVLVLGTKDMLHVEQSEHLGDIVLKRTDRAKANQAVEVSDAEEETDDDDETSDGGVEITGSRRLEDDADEEQHHVKEEQGHAQEEAGHFEEQFKAGRAEIGEDDRDELYDD
ncbi:hypothetical protein CC86DRAFT_464616 [Ophiobolus disseminans]|uniref:Rad21/Rec8-like protein N-terminal domain-containing protein n=1 Tax=Ophiobolus disseminans TaxID=1469910 RepID=A0A6A7AA60_9PLEO|nr:hypothetical protein CC86DRAFT_464616 [Ophiobolus disseminans]